MSIEAVRDMMANGAVAPKGRPLLSQRSCSIVMAPINMRMTVVEGFKTKTIDAKVKRHLAEYCFRLNRCVEPKKLLSQLGQAAIMSPSMPYRLST